MIGALVADLGKRCISAISRAVGICREKVKPCYEKFKNGIQLKIEFRGRKSILEKYSNDITAEVMCKVDLSLYETRVENRKKAEELRKKMDQKIAEMDEMNKYVVYAEKNPELAKMLEEYRELV